MSVSPAASVQPNPDDLVPAGATRRDWLGLVVLAGAVMLIAVDGTVLDIALPFLSADLRPSSTELLWIIDVYSFVLAGLLVTMGTVGDRIGRRRLLLIGAVGFGLSSVLAAFAVDPAMMIAARVLQGISGATLMPATLGLIRTMFQVRRERTLAIGVWGAMAGGGAAAGPLVGGWLLEHFWWGSVFLINVPIMIALVVVGPFTIPESKDPEPGRFDVPSAALSILAIVPVVYAIKETAAHGPHPSMIPVALVGLAAGTVFVRRQGRLAAPMIDLMLFAQRRFSTAVATNLLSVFALAGVLFFGSQYLQSVLGTSPLEAGLIMLPGTATSIVASLAAAHLVRRWEAGTVLAVGLGVSAAGALLLTRLGQTDGIAVFMASFVLVGVGAGLALTLTSDLVVASVPAPRAGAASAISETAYELGIALGVALLGSVVMAVFRGGIDTSALDPDTASGARETIGEAVSLARTLPADLGDALTSSAGAAFVDGMHVAAVATAIVLAANALLVALALRGSDAGDARADPESRSSGTHSSTTKE
ncbi:MFS transporter [Rhodococcus sp. SORGH_AS_0301]|uniref:MFS transporter n=1 Tax=Rhodococcus sp. SORGH_AS_0301 TaxID=3041780 RepID=UPI00277EE8E2|nr:MFS transporter [Rhodococcus sp. SORGH_AS_0301]MDQ1179908.1 DHA2 family multidrug resistance protein-like MFS transporter [Rhodococcus sp. SORGH_AS_0301]